MMGRAIIGRALTIFLKNLLIYRDKLFSKGIEIRGNIINEWK
jgi:hypothetical protein